MLDLRHPVILAALTLARAVRRVGGAIPKGYPGLDKMFEACDAFEAAYREEMEKQAFGEGG